MGKNSTKKLDGISFGVSGSADCPCCTLLSSMGTVLDAMGVSNVSAFAFGDSESFKSPIRGKLNSVSHRLYCSIHGSLDENNNRAGRRKMHRRK